jgi:hypothetical protein
VLPFALFDLREYAACCCDSSRAIRPASRSTPAADHPAILERQRRLGHQRGEQFSVAQVGQARRTRASSRQSFGREVGKRSSHRGKFRPSEVASARTGRAGWRLSSVTRLSSAPNPGFRPARGAALRGRPGRSPWTRPRPIAADLLRVNRGAQHPGAQQALAHGGYRAVDRAKERGALARGGEEGLDQLQIARR